MAAQSKSAGVEAALGAVMIKHRSARSSHYGGLSVLCVSLPADMDGALVQKAINVYATATLSGDVANALALLKRMTRPTLRKQKAGLLIPPKELACCHVRLLCHTTSHQLAFTLLMPCGGSV